MNLNKFTEKAQEAVVTTQQLAQRNGNPEMLPEHLLVALLDQPEGIVPAVLGKMKIDPVGMATSAKALLTRLPKVQGGNEPDLSARLRKVFTLAEDATSALKDEFTSTEHLLVGLVTEEGRSPLIGFARGGRQYRGNSKSG
jgi:ATP-dependent Clp protease ATP-binding subunit ClpB